MSGGQTDFLQSIVESMGYKSKQDIIQRLFIQSLCDSYGRVDKRIGNENEIRDRMVKDLYKTDSPIREWIQNKYIDLIWENWVFTTDFELARTDIAFKLFTLHFVIECKRLKSAETAYLVEGLERFISLKYARGDEYAGMIGFVIAGDKLAICAGLKDKINGLGHTESVTEISPDFRFKSVHGRIDSSRIEISHLFFDFQLA